MYLTWLIVEASIVLHFVAASLQMHTTYILYKYCLKIWKKLFIIIIIIKYVNDQKIGHFCVQANTLFCNYCDQAVEV